MHANLDDVHSMLLLDGGGAGTRGHPPLRRRHVAEHRRSRCAPDVRARRLLAAASMAIEALTGTSAGLEVEGARTARGWALAHEDRWEESVQEMALAESTPFEAVKAEVFVDVASIHAAYGSRIAAESYVERAIGSALASEVVLDIARVTQAELALRIGDVARATECLNGIAANRPHPYFAFAARVKLARAMCSIAGDAVEAGRDSAAISHHAARQGARLYGLPARILRGAVTGREDLEAAVTTVAAEVFLGPLDGCGAASRSSGRSECGRSPGSGARSGASSGALARAPPAQPHDGGSCLAHRRGFDSR